MKDISEGLTVAVVQMPIADDPRVNADRFITYVQQAAAQGADIIVGSELMISKYLIGDRFEDDAYVRYAVAQNQYIASALKDIEAIVIFGNIGLDEDPVKVGEDGRLRKYNAAFVLERGAFLRNDAGLSFAIKTLHPNYRMFDDTRHFYSLRAYAEERGVPVEHLLRPFTVSVRGVSFSLGVVLCEDMWDQDYIKKPVRILAENGADLFVNLSCSPWSWRKNQKRDQVVRTLLRDLKRWFVYVNNVGSQNNGKNFITFDGASTIYNPRGEIVALTEPYREGVLVLELRSINPTLYRREEGDVEQLYRAIEVATKGYLETVPSFAQKKIVIGVSGGVDSALSLAFFTRLLGPDRIIGVNMPYKHYNAPETRNDAATLAARLGVEYRVQPIDDLVDALAATVRATEGTGAHKTLQAQVRMQMLAAVARVEDGIFVCNANKAEIAFGYGTLNGDLRGAFAPWMDCLKQDVYRLADYLNSDIFCREVIPASILARPPMDELVAIGAGERSDPFKYGHIDYNGYHDEMVRALVSFRKSPEWFLECYREGTLEAEMHLRLGTLQRHFGESAQAFVDDLERCYTLVTENVFKRVQSVPGPLVDKRSFGWDLRESIHGVVWTDTYRLSKELLLTK